MNIKLFIFTFVVLALAILPADLAAQRKRPHIKPVTVTITAGPQTPAQRRLEAFHTAWSTLDDNYFDKTFGGLDWEKIRTEYEPRVAAARTDAEFHRILQEMISRLGKSHLNIIVPEYFEKLENAKKEARLKGEQLAAEKRDGRTDGNGDGADDDDEDFGDPAGTRYGIGVELRMLAQQIVITHVDTQSGAAIAGLKPGYVIEKINGVALSEIVEKALINGSSAKDIRYMLPIEIGESFLNGGADTSVFLTCLDETDKSKEFTVPRLRLAGEAISISKNLPEQFLKYESLSLNPDVGYIKFTVFAMPVLGKFCDSLTQFADKKAIIIDLRGNLGGILGSVLGLSGMLTDKPLTLGTFRNRAGSEPFAVTAKNKHFSGRIAVLVDSESMSASEIFSAGLQGNGRTIVVGERTGGKSLPAVWTRLSTGAVMVYPIADFITTKGASLEGVGLEPDQVVALERKSLLQGEDTQLNKALALIATETAAAKIPEQKPEKPLGLGLSTAEPPPPPPPMRRPPPKAAQGPVATASPSDARSLAVIADFAAAAGGVEAVKRIASYEARGSMTANGQRGDGEMDIYAARQFPDKSLMVLSSPAIGEVREISNGKMSFLQSDYGLDRSLYPNSDTTRAHLLAPFFNVLDPQYLRGMKYEGEYEVDGHMRRVVSATSTGGFAIGLSFDSATKMLSTYSMPGAVYTLGDYRKIDGVMIPFQVDMDRFMNVRLTSVTINPKLDPGNFEKKERCFDKAN